MEQVERLARDQKRQGGIEAAGNSQGQRSVADMLDSFCQAGDLGVEDLLTALAKLFFAARDEWMGVDVAQQFQTCRPFYLERDAPPGALARHGLRVAETVGPEALVDESVDV